MIWFAGWGPRYGYMSYATTGAGLIDRINANYHFLMDTLGEIIAPIGDTWERLIPDSASFDLWGPDNTHPSIFGTFTAACTIYATIFKSSPLGSTYIMPGTSAATDSIIESTSFNTVTDSFNNIGLPPYTPIIINTGDSLQVLNGFSCGWYRNDTLLPFATSAIDLLQNGSYYAIVADSNGCTERTRPFEVANLAVAEPKARALAIIKILPNPSTSGATIVCATGIETMYIYNLLGQEMAKINLPAPATEIVLPALPSGIYTVRCILVSGHSTVTTAVVK
jgi:hypothetical protein